MRIAKVRERERSFVLVSAYESEMRELAGER